MKNKQAYVKRNLYTGGLVTFKAHDRPLAPFRKGRISPYQPDETGKIVRVKMEEGSETVVSCEGVYYIEHDDQSAAPDRLKPRRFHRNF